MPPSAWPGRITQPLTGEGTIGLPFGSELMYLPDRAPILLNLSTGELEEIPGEPARARGAHLPCRGVQLARLRHHPRVRLPRTSARPQPAAFLLRRRRVAARRVPIGRLPRGLGAAPGPAAHGPPARAGRRAGAAAAPARATGWCATWKPAPCEAAARPGRISSSGATRPRCRPPSPATRAAWGACRCRRTRVSAAPRSGSLSPRAGGDRGSGAPAHRPGGTGGRQLRPGLRGRAADGGRRNRGRRSAWIRAATRRGTINLNTNAGRPDRRSRRLCAAGLDSIRVSVNSLRPECYRAYFRPKGFTTSPTCCAASTPPLKAGSSCPSTT